MQPAGWPAQPAQYANYQTTVATNLYDNLYEYLQHMVRPVDAEAVARAQAKRIAASDRAEELLLSFLRKEHKKSYQEDGHFDVEVKGRIYRIHKGRSMNITLLDKKGVKICRYCAHPSECVPDADTMLAQYLMLTIDEKKFLAIANKHRLAA